MIDFYKIIKKTVKKPKDSDIKSTDNKASIQFNQRKYDLLNSIINSIDTPFVVLNRKSSIIKVNSASDSIFGLSQFKNIFHVFRWPDFKINVNNFIKSRKKSTSFDMEYVEGTRKYLYLVKMYKLSEGYTLLSFTDHTRMNTLEKIRTDFIGNISHELKTPLATVSGIVELFSNQKNINSREKSKFTKILIEETKRMTNIIQDLLRLSKIESQLFDKPKELINLNFSIIKVIKSFKTKSAKRKIKINFLEKLKNVSILGDPEQITLMIENIIENSLKYARTNSKITITIKREKNENILIFEDKSEGIPKSIIPRLTERFYRAEFIKDKRVEGTGLGLAIVKHIANRHNIKFNIESSIGEGTKVIFKLKRSPSKQKFNPSL